MIKYVDFFEIRLNLDNINHLLLTSVIKFIEDTTFFAGSFQPGYFHCVHNVMSREIMLISTTITIYHIIYV